MPQPHERDLEQTRADLAAWLPGRLPQACDLEVASLGGPESTGFSSDTLMYDLAWTEKGERRSAPVVVRLEPSGFQIFPEYDITIQYRCMDILRGEGVSVPRMMWLEQDAGVLGAPFYVMERIDGRIPPDRPPYHMEGWLLESTPEQRRKLWLSGLEAMAKIHACDWRRLGFEFLDDRRYGPTGLGQQLGYYDYFLGWAMDGRPFPLAERVLKWLRENAPADEPTRLCWGDSRIGNQIFDDYQCVAVLDWEMATLGNPARDLAWYIYLDRHHCEGIGVERLAGLPSRQETVARWEELTGLDGASTVDYYEIFSAFCFTVIMIRVANQMKYYELLPDDSDFDVNNTASAFLEKLFGR